MLENKDYGPLCHRALQSIALDISPTSVGRLNIDRWVAASLLQKGIRRGDQANALAAADALLRANPAAFWRRILVIGWEDIAFGDLEVCFAATGASKSKRWRDALGERELGLALTARMCRATKNRVADDVVTVIENENQSLADAKALGESDRDSLWRLALPNDRCILKRSVAAWLLIGTKRIPCNFLPRVEGDTAEFFAAFCSDQLSHPMQCFAADAVNRSRTLLPATIAMLEQDWRNTRHSGEVRDELIATGSVGGIPEYAFDGHTRAGCRYLQRLSRADSDLFLWLEEHVHDEQRLPMLKKLFFRSVSAQCDRRQAWGKTEDLRQKANSVGFLLDPADFKVGLSTFRRAIAEFPVAEILS